MPATNPVPEKKKRKARHGKTERRADDRRYEHVASMRETEDTGSDPLVGDITYYSPWGNLTIFYRHFRYAGGLIKLGRIDSGAEALNVPGSVKVTAWNLRMSRSRAIPSVDRAAGVMPGSSPYNSGR
jgi:hypothetical protein